MGFEPTEGCPSNDFESFAFDHSATSPGDPTSVRIKPPAQLWCHPLVEPAVGHQARRPRKTWTSRALGTNPNQTASPRRPCRSQLHQACRTGSTHQRCRPARRARPRLSEQRRRTASPGLCSCWPGKRRSTVVWARADQQ